MNIILDAVSLRNCLLIIQMHNILYTIIIIITCLLIIQIHNIFYTIIIITWKLYKKLYNTFTIKMKRGIRATRLSEEISSIDVNLVGRYCREDQLFKKEGEKKKKKGGSKNKKLFSIFESVRSDKIIVTESR